MSNALIQELINEAVSNSPSARMQTVNLLKQEGEAVVQSLMEVIYRGDEQKRLNVSEVIWEVGQLMIPPLLEALDHPDTEVRRFGAWNLGHLARFLEKPPVETCIRLLADENVPTRWSATWALGRFKDVRAVEPIIRNLTHPDFNLRGVSAESLGLLQDRRALEPLLSALNDESNHVRYWAATALGQLGDSQVTEVLFEKMFADDRNIRIAAATALQQLENIPFSPHLRLILESDDQQVQYLGVSLLGKCQDKRAVDWLLELIHSSVQYVQAGALSALGNPRNLRAVQPIIQLIEAAHLQSPDPNAFLIVHSGFYALGRIGGAQATAFMLRYLRNDGLNWFPAVQALARLGTDEIINEIDKLLRDATLSAETRSTIATMVFQAFVMETNTTFIKFFLESKYDFEVSELDQILGTLMFQMFNASIAQIFIDYLISGDTPKRLRAVGIFRALYQSFKSAIQSLQDHGEYEYGDEIQWKSQVERTSIDPLIAVLDTPPETRTWIIAALVEMGELAVDRLIAAQQDTDAAVREAAKEALQKIQSKQVSM